MLGRLSLPKSPLFQDWLGLGLASLRVQADCLSLEQAQMPEKIATRPGARRRPGGIGTLACFELLVATHAEQWD